MHKRYLHHLWVKLRPVSHWYFLAACIFFSLLFVHSYRQNNLEMIRRRDALFAADEKGKGVEKALRELRQYVHAHMNTRLVSGDTAIRPPIQLKHEYERRVAQERTRVEQANAELAKEAERICQQRFPVTENVTGLQPCIEGYLNDNGVKQTTIPKEAYQFDFVSPTWSPDVAGWSLVAAIFSGLLFLTRYALDRWLRQQLSDHA